MKNNEPKIDKALMLALDKLTDEEEIYALLYPKQMGENLKKFLMSRKNEGKLDYNILEIANCIAVKAGKRVILAIAAREDVARVTIQPKLTTNWMG